MIPVSFSFLLSFFIFRFYVMFFLVNINFYFIIILFIFNFFMKITFIFFMFRDFSGCSGMFRNAPCSGFYRRPIKLFSISFITSNIVRRFDLSRTQNFRRIIACLILLVLKVHVLKKGVFWKENLFFDMIK